jgi:hypothetical protein
MRRTLFALALTCAVFAHAACGNVKNNPDAPPPPIDAMDDIDGAPPPIDAAVDAMPPPIDAPPPSPGQEFGAAGGRVGGATFTMDVQLGHPVGQQQLQGSTFRLEANTPIKP